MNICVVAYKFGTEKEIGEHLGTYHYFIEKMRTLVRQGHQVTVVAPWLSFMHRGSREVDGVRIVRYWPPVLNVVWAWPLNRIVRLLYITRTGQVTQHVVEAQNSEIVYIWQARETGYAVLKVKEKLGAPVIFRQITAWKWHFERTVNDVYGKRGWYQRVSRTPLRFALNKVLAYLLDAKTQVRYAHFIYGKADRVVLLSEAAVNEAVAFGLDRKKARVLGVAIETDLFAPAQNRDELRKQLGISGPTILFIGRINFAEKGIGFLLEAMPEVFKSVPDAHLVVIGGGGETERMRKLIAQLGISNQVVLAGKQPFSQLPKYCAAADIQVVPSVWMEAFGQVTIEGMACGTPVVTSDAGASPEININEETGLVVPAANSQALAQALIRLIQDDTLRNQFGAAARRRVEQEYSYAACTQKCLSIIQETILKK